MINRIKSNIKKFIDVRIRLIKDQQRVNEQITFNYNQISKLFKEDSFIPFSAWSISPSTILHILNDITINKRKCIIEFGSGSSTFFIAKLIKTLKCESTFYTIESDENWANELKRQLEIYNLENHVTVIYAPLVEVADNLSYNAQKTWYDLEKFKNLISTTKFDLIIVDGPYGGSTPFARYSAIPFLLDKLAENYTVFLDDINRNDERFIAAEWGQILNGEFKFIERYAVFSTNQKFDVSPFQLKNFPL